jgi:hypothetical protein
MCSIIGCNKKVNDDDDFLCETHEKIHFSISSYRQVAFDDESLESLNEYSCLYKHIFTHIYDVFEGEPLYSNSFLYLSRIKMPQDKIPVYYMYYENEFSILVSNGDNSFVEIYRGHINNSSQYLTRIYSLTKLSGYFSVLPRDILYMIYSEILGFDYHIIYISPN